MNANYDLVIVGGGVGGAALAGSMASAGARVLVLEAESRFRDRVRGEAIMPWGVAEVKLLGLERTLIQAAANPLPFWDSYAGADRSSHRDLRRTTSVEEPALACYHPKLQESLLRWAEGCGAEVRRGVRVTGLDTSRNSPDPLCRHRGRNLRAPGSGCGRTRFHGAGAGRLPDLPGRRAKPGVRGADGTGGPL